MSTMYHQNKIPFRRLGVTAEALIPPTDVRKNKSWNHEKIKAITTAF